MLAALGPVFLEARASAGHAWTGDVASLEPILAAHLDAGRAGAPGIDLAPERFVAHLARRLPAAATAADLHDLRAAELYLACACADGDSAAIELFERRYFGEVDAAAARMRCPPAIADDVKQILGRVLFVAEGERAPATAGYGGRGDLRGWVRVSAVRELQRLLAKEKRSVPFEEERFLDALAPEQDPELGYLRARYQRELAEALAAAIAATPERERALLRLAVLHGLGIDGIGRLYGVHRATAARWLARARAGILERTRAELAHRVGVAATDVDSIIRLVQSRLDVSVARILG
jgi:RNA polymerase sigma-70 factor (ECF subfamily)